MAGKGRAGDSAPCRGHETNSGFTPNSFPVFVRTRAIRDVPVRTRLTLVDQVALSVRTVTRGFLSVPRPAGVFLKEHRRFRPRDATTLHHFRASVLPAELPTAAEWAIFIHRGTMSGAHASTRSVWGSVIPCVGLAHLASPSRRLMAGTETGLAEAFCRLPQALAASAHGPKRPFAFRTNLRTLCDTPGVTRVPIEARATARRLKTPATAKFGSTHTPTRRQRSSLSPSLFRLKPFALASFRPVRSRWFLVRAHFLMPILTGFPR